MIYFIFSPDDPRSLVKIGYTKGPLENRLAALQATMPFRLCVMMVVEGDMTDERKLHRRFRESRCHGEWFYPTDDLKRFVYGLEVKPYLEELEEDLADPTLEEERRNLLVELRSCAMSV